DLTGSWMSAEAEANCSAESWERTPPCAEFSMTFPQLSQVQRHCEEEPYGLDVRSELETFSIRYPRGLMRMFSSRSFTVGTTKTRLESLETVDAQSDPMEPLS